MDFCGHQGVKELQKKTKVFFSCTTKEIKVKSIFSQPFDGLVPFLVAKFSLSFRPSDTSAENMNDSRVT